MGKSSAKPKNRLLKLAASAVTFQNPPFSPSKEKRSSDAATHKIRKGFSGPMISIIPAEARYKSRSSSFAAHEPTSPKISCMGQIKHKKKTCSLNKQHQPPRDHQQFVSHSTPLEQQVNNSKKPKVLKSTQSFAEVKKTNPQQQRVLKSVQSFDGEKKKKTLVIRNIFAKAAVKKGDHSVDRGAPSLGQMQRFSSGRNSLSNFDWTAGAEHDRNYHSDEETESDREEEEEEEEDCKIAFSAPIILIGGCKEGEPRKEINLWKRRTMAQPPRPLQLNNNK